MKQVLGAIEGWETQRANVDYKTDGMVVKVDELTLRERMGVTDKFPKWCKAYKYQADQERTVLQEVTPQVGRTGVITPVASFDPVWLAGTTVTNATLHNFDEIARLDIRKGDTIVVQKAGEVIPQVLRVDKDMRPAHSVPIGPPQDCPSCGKALKWDPPKPRHTAFMCVNHACDLFMQRRQRIGKVTICRMKVIGQREPRGCDHNVQLVDHMVELRCVNPECPHQFRERLLHFAGRGQMDIEGIGEETVKLLLASGVVKHFSDLYRLTKDDLLRLELEERLKEDVAHKKLEEQLKGSAGRKLGAGVSAALASFFRDIYAVANADQQELMSTAGIDKESADRVYGKFHESKTADNLLAAIEASKHRGLARVLGALGIRGVGARNARALAMAFPRIDDLMEANEIEIRDKFRKAMKSETSDKPATHIAKEVYEFFQQKENIAKIDDLPEGLSVGDQIVRLGVPKLKVESIRKKRLPLLQEAFEDVASLALASAKEIQDALEETGTVAGSVYRFLHEEGGDEIIESLREVGVKMTQESPPKKAAAGGVALEGKTVVVTGTLKGFSRKEAEDAIEGAGGKVGDNVSGKTSFVVVGEDPGSKLAKAHELGVETIDEKEFSRRVHVKERGKLF
jgi:DNA ligase (NAD+)